jgi:hypothetical protein
MSQEGIKNMGIFFGVPIVAIFVISPLNHPAPFETRSYGELARQGAGPICAEFT